MNETPPGRVITVFAAKDGCGKTTLATNLAVVLNDAGNRVCLLDLDLTFGDVAGSLRLEPRRTLGDLAGRGDVPDQAAIESATTRYRDGLDCLLAPVRPGESRWVSQQLIGFLLAELPDWYDYVVVDTPGQFSPHVLVALDCAHHLVVLSTPDRPALRNLRRTLDLLDLLSYRQENRSVVLNRCDPELSSVDTESVGRVAARLPSTVDVLDAASPDRPLGQAIRQFVDVHIVATQPKENQQQ